MQVQASFITHASVTISRVGQVKKQTSNEVSPVNEYQSTSNVQPPTSCTTDHETAEPTNEDSVDPSNKVSIEISEPRTRDPTSNAGPNLEPRTRDPTSNARPTEPMNKGNPRARQSLPPSLVCASLLCKLSREHVRCGHELAEMDVPRGRESSRPCSLSWRRSCARCWLEASDVVCGIQDGTRKRRWLEGQGRLQYELRYVCSKTLRH
jgi:hypothetical protein